MAGEMTIDWGDGSPKEDAPAAGEVTHEYAESEKGEEQTITVCAKDNPNACTEVKFTPGEDGGTDEPTDPPTDEPTDPPTDEPTDPPTDPPTEEPGELTAKESEDTSDKTRMTTKLAVDNSGQGPVNVDWGDGSDPQKDVEEKGEVKHKYARAGKFTGTVTDADDDSRTAKFEVTVPYGPTDEPEEPTDPPTDEPTDPPTDEPTDPPTDEPTDPPTDEPEGLTLKVKPDPADAGDKRTVIATVDNGGKPAMIDFGEGEPKENKGDGQEDTPYEYSKDGEYTVTATDKEDQAVKDTAQVTVPPEGDSEKPKVTADKDAGDDSGRTVKAAWSGFGEDKVTVDWGDDSDPEKGLDPKAEATHEYGEKVTDEQTITVTSEADDAKKATATFTPGDDAKKARTARARRYR